MDQDTSTAKTKKFTEFPDVWATAGALVNGSLQADGFLKTVPASTERHLIVVGGKSSGKTSLIARYLEKKVEDRDTVGVSYYDWKRQRDDSLITDLGNIWEIGSSAYMKEMLDIVVSHVDSRNLIVFVVIDISKPETIAAVLGNTLPLLNDTIKAFSDVTVWIVGNKFDRQASLNLELDKRQAIADFLRQLTSTYAFGLIYTSHQNSTDPRLKTFWDSWFLRETATDYPVVTDALNLVFVPPATLSRPPITADDGEQWRNVLNSVITQKPATEFRPSKELTDTKLYAEPALDDAFSLLSAELKAKTKALNRLQYP